LACPAGSPSTLVGVDRSRSRTDGPSGPPHVLDPLSGATLRGRAPGRYPSTHGHGVASLAGVRRPPLVDFEPSSLPDHPSRGFPRQGRPRRVHEPPLPVGRLPNARSARTVVGVAEAPHRHPWGSMVPNSPGHPARQGRQSALFRNTPPRLPALEDPCGCTSCAVTRTFGSTQARSAPPSTSSRRVHSRESAGEPDILPSASASHGRSPVPSSWFLTTPTAFSARRLAGLLHPAADPGVRPVSPLRPSSPFAGAVGRSRFPGTHTTPRSAPLLRSRSAVTCALLPPRRCPPRRRRLGASAVSGVRSCATVLREPRPRGLAPRTSPYLHVAVSGAARPALPGLSRIGGPSPLIPTSSVRVWDRRTSTEVLARRPRANRTRPGGSQDLGRGCSVAAAPP